MPDDSIKSSKRVLEPHERIAEVLFGLIMVLTSTGSLSVAEVGRSEIRHMLISALGCNLAWGVIDGPRFPWRCLSSSCKTRQAPCVSNAIAVVMLFVTGFAYGRCVGRYPWRFGIAMVLVGDALVALTVALGDKSHAPNIIFPPRDSGFVRGSRVRPDRDDQYRIGSQPGVAGSGCRGEAKLVRFRLGLPIPRAR